MQNAHYLRGLLPPALMGCPLKCQVTFGWGSPFTSHRMVAFSPSLTVITVAFSVNVIFSGRVRENNAILMTDPMAYGDSSTYGTQSNRRIYYADFHQQLRRTNCPCRPVRCGRKRFSIVLRKENKQSNATESEKEMENGKLSKEYIEKG